MKYVDFLAVLKPDVELYSLTHVASSSVQSLFVLHLPFTFFVASSRLGDVPDEINLASPLFIMSVNSVHTI